MANKRNNIQGKSITTLVSIIIVVLSNISIISENVPTWFYVLILIVSLLLIYYCVSVIIKGVTNTLNCNFDKINSNIEKSYSNLNDAICLNTNKISDSVDNSTIQIKDILNTQSADIKKDFMSLGNKVSSYVEDITKCTCENASEVIRKMQESSELLKNEVVNLGKSVTTNIAENTAILKHSIVDAKNVELTTRENIIVSITDNYKLISNLIDQLSKQNTILQEALDSANINLNTNSEVINNTIKESIRLFSALMKSVEINIHENVNSQTLDIKNNVINSISSFKQEFEVHKDASSSQRNELKACMNDGIKAITMLISQTETAENASEKQQQIIDTITVATSKIEHLEGSNVQYKTDIIENTNNQVQDIKASVQKNILALTDNVTCQMENLASSIEQVGGQSTTTLSVVHEFSTKLEDKYANIHINVEALKSLLGNAATSANASENQRVLIDSLNKLSGKLDELSKASELRKSALIESNEMQILHIDESIDRAISKLAEKNPTAEKILDLYLESISEINNTISRLDTRSENIQFALDELKENDNISNVITSINGIVDVMRGEIKNSFADVSNQILDSQIAQETLQQQLINLNVILRTLEKSVQTSVKEVNEQSKEEYKSTKPNKTETITNKVTKNVVENNHVKSVQTSVKEASKQSKEEYKSTNPNRTETIIDEVTKNVVENNYVNGYITKTIMRTPKGKPIYEMEYKSGVIARTKNYDEKGKVNIDQTYYSNGQVHFRNEFTKSGKITTEFDINGNIKK